MYILLLCWGILMFPVLFFATRIVSMNEEDTPESNVEQ